LEGQIIWLQEEIGILGNDTGAEDLVPVDEPSTRYPTALRTTICPSQDRPDVRDVGAEVGQSEVERVEAMMDKRLWIWATIILALILIGNLGGVWLALTL
jgi:hypothetical protein